MQSIEAARRAPFADNPRVGELGARTQQRIVAAAMEVFATRGFDAALVKHITAAAGCSRPTFYQYFASKEDLFRKVAGRVAVDMAAMIDRPATVTADEAGRDELHRWLVELATYYRTHPVVFSTFAAAARTDPTLRSGSQLISHRFARGLVQQVEQPPAQWDEAHASIVMGMVVRALVLHARSGTGLTADRFTHSLADLVHRCVFGPIPDVNAGPLRRAPRSPHGAVTVEVADGVSRHPGLVAAGRTSFIRLGRHATRVDDIVEGAGVSHGTFYRYFHNKDELFGLLLRQTVATLAGLAAEFPVTEDPADVRRWLERWFDAFAEHGALFSAWKDADMADPFVAGHEHEVAGPVVMALRARLARRGFGDADADAVALIALVQRMPSVSLLGGLDRDQVITLAHDLVQRAFVAAR